MKGGTKANLQKLKTLIFSQISANIYVSIWDFTRIVQLSSGCAKLGADMRMMAFRIIRATVLGLMFFLAMTAACSTDSYDPNPYDDIPPVVTVEYNYLVPSRVSVRCPNVQAKIRRRGVSSVAAVLQASASKPALFEAQATPALQLGSPQSAIPLRR